MHGISAACWWWLHRKCARAIVYACKGILPWRTLVIELLSSYRFQLSVVSLAAFDRNFSLSDLIPLVGSRGRHSAIISYLAFKSPASFIIVARPRSVALAPGMMDTRG